MFNMEKIDLEKEKQEQKEFDKHMKKQNRIKNEFAFLMTCDKKEFQAKFIKAQAIEICKYLERLKFTPFKSWETKIKELVEHEDFDFLYQFYITKNEYGEYIPDESRIQELILTDPDPEEFPETRN